jgi:integrase
VLKEGQDKGKGRITWERGFHSLRHTFTSWLRNAGVSEEDRMALTGHSTRESHQIYSHADEKAGQAAIAKLPSLNSKK